MLDCPGCGKSLESATSLEGPRPLSLTEREQILTCGACLAIVCIGSEQVGESGAWSPVARVHISGGVIARALDRLREADQQGVLVDAFDEIRADPERGIALRVPSVFAAARRAIAGRAAIGSPIFLHVTRESAAFESPGGGVGVRGFWAPFEKELTAEVGDGAPRFLTYPPTADEPDLHQPPAMLQAWDGYVMMRAGAPVRVLRDEGTLLVVLPENSRWVRDGLLEGIRVPLDLLAPAD